MIIGFDKTKIPLINFLYISRKTFCIRFGKKNVNNEMIFSMNF